MEALVKNLLQIHLKIAKDTFPNGGVLQCRACGTQIKFTRKEAAEYLQAGWPKHCGKAMRILKER